MKSINLRQKNTLLFDPNGVGLRGRGIFGLPFNYKESKLILLPVPWDVTVSYGAGTRNGPKAILDASPQLDLYDPFFKEIWRNGISMNEISSVVMQKCSKLRVKAERHIENLEKGKIVNSNTIKEVNSASRWLNDWVYKESKRILSDKKFVGLLGGDHSTPLGLLRALSEKMDSFGILQLDAHMDLRDAYEDFEFSHASIMFNALKITNVSKIVQVGIRDFCKAELDYSRKLGKRINVFFDIDMKRSLLRGKAWDKIVKSIITSLPKKVYISFDMNSLESWLCPSTGTPVPGGLSFDMATYLLHELSVSGKEIIGFDLNEVSPGKNKSEWDANVGARILYKLCGTILAK